MWVLPLNNPKDLDLSYKMNIVFVIILEGKKKLCLTAEEIWYINNTVLLRNILNKLFCTSKKEGSGEPGLVDRVLALHTGSRGFDSHQGHMS